jgi:hypothetical protein
VSASRAMGTSLRAGTLAGRGIWIRRFEGAGTVEAQSGQVYCRFASQDIAGALATSSPIAP